MKIKTYWIRPVMSVDYKNYQFWNEGNQLLLSEITLERLRMRLVLHYIASSGPECTTYRKLWELSSKQVKSRIQSTAQMIWYPWRSCKSREWSSTNGLHMIPLGAGVQDHIRSTQPVFDKNQGSEVKLLCSRLTFYAKTISCLKG